MHREVYGSGGYHSFMIFRILSAYLIIRNVIHHCGQVTRVCDHVTRHCGHVTRVCGHVTRHLRHVTRHYPVA